LLENKNDIENEKSTSCYKGVYKFAWVLFTLNFITPITFTILNWTFYVIYSNKSTHSNITRQKLSLNV
jgi:hypothetical protein